MRDIRLCGAPLALVGCVSACGGSSPSGPSSTASPAPAPLPTPTAASARYTVTFEATWSAESHADDFPRNPHFSPLVGGTHSSRVRFWAPGEVASAGIEAMAELGRTSPLDSEVEAAIASGTAHGLVRGDGISRSPGLTTAEFEVVRDHPLVSLVTMVAPSPDWFVGVNSLSLVEGGDWVAEKVVTLYPWDAGTDDGMTYAAEDHDSQPRQPIRALSGHPVAVRGSVPLFGRFRFRRVS